ncbi:MAG TPA: hypothetical protein VHA11_02315 [Bryobacteraceae bacterium]|nr:hypothetical protein [Bryobacteraceae bacterium]
MVLAGVAVVKAPLLAWILIGIAAVIASLELRASSWVFAALAAVGLSRLLVFCGAPAFLNFVHFPIVLGGVVAAFVQGKSSRVTRTIAISLSAFLAFCFLSWALNGGELLRPVLAWLVFSEPFLLVLALSKAPPEPRAASRLWFLVFGIAFLQLPLGIVEWAVLSHGDPDRVQGSFLGQGAGAHVAGAVALVGVLAAVTRAANERAGLRQQGFIALAMAMFFLPILSDAKQVIICFIPAVLVALVSSGRLKVSRLVLPFLILCLGFTAAFRFYRPLQQLGDSEKIEVGLLTKLDAVDLILEGMLRTTGGWLIGVGPGNSVSRIALLTSGAEVMESSPVARLGLKTAPLTREILRANTQNYLSNNSSVWTGVSSWSGLMGDLGLAGLLLYLALNWKLWRALGRQGSWAAAAGKGGLVMAGLLGFVFSWLEEPGFTLLVAAVIGLALAAPARVESARVFAVRENVAPRAARRPLRPQFR